MTNDHPIATTVDEITRRFETINGARDRALAEGRLIVRLAANAVRAVHRAEFPEATRLLDDARHRLTMLRADLAPFPSLFWAGYVQNAMKEYAEARLAYAIVHEEPLPSPEVLGVEDAPYLNALVEAASELRRQVLDLLRAGDIDRAERQLAVMEEIYSALVTVDLADAIAGGLRRTTDNLRAVLERTRSDLTLTLTQQRLERALREVQADLQRAP